MTESEESMVKGIQSTNVLLSKDAILAAQDVVTEIVEVPEWGGAVRVRGLTGAERDAFESEYVQRAGQPAKTNLRNIRARLVVLSVVDEQGSRLFSFPDIAALGEKAAKPLDRIFSVAMRLSGIRYGDVQEMAEDFESTPGGG